MKKIIILILILVILTSGYIYLNNNPITEQDIIKNEVSDEYFLSIYEEEVEAINEPEIKIVARGDINMNGLEDAVVLFWSCGASCGYSYDFILQNYDSVPTFLMKGERYESLIIGSSAAKTDVTDIEINDGKVIFTGYGFGDDRWDNRDELKTYEFSIIDGVLN